MGRKAKSRVPELNNPHEQKQKQTKPITMEQHIANNNRKFPAQRAFVRRGVVS